MIPSDSRTRGSSAKTTISRDDFVRSQSRRCCLCIAVYGMPLEATASESDSHHISEASVMAPEQLPGRPRAITVCPVLLLGSF